MTFPFAKMHGAGNDFVVLADPDARFPLADAALVRRICAPHVGLVCEGLLVLRRADAPAGSDFRMVFFNPDGSRAGMCGNGARCAALFAFRNGWTGRAGVFASDAGPVPFEVAADGRRVSVGMKDVDGFPPGGCTLSNGDSAAPRPAGFDGGGFWKVDTGVPHAVKIVSDVSAVPVDSWGAYVRHHGFFGPDGTNVDFVQILGRHAVAVRTFERGVEAETAACGTGATAAALVAAVMGCDFPVAVRVASGDELTVGCAEFLGCDGARGVSLAGPARFVCRGALDTDDFS